MLLSFSTKLVVSVPWWPGSHCGGRHFCTSFDGASTETMEPVTLLLKREKWEPGLSVNCVSCDQDSRQ